MQFYAKTDSSIHESKEPTSSYRQRHALARAVSDLKRSAKMKIQLVALLLIVMLMPACNHKGVSEKSLSRFNAGYDLDLFLKESGLDKKEFEMTPNLSTEDYGGRYKVKEGIVFVSAVKDKNGRWILDSQPSLLESKYIK